MEAREPTDSKKIIHCFPVTFFSAAPFLFCAFIMGKSFQSAPMLNHELSRFVSSPIPQSHMPNQIQPIWCNRATAKSSAIRVESLPMQPKKENSNGVKYRVPLAEVVADCAKRWFLGTLEEAKAGNTSMQLLVGQMYSTGYGVPTDPQKVKILQYATNLQFLPYICYYQCLIMYLPE